MKTRAEYIFVLCVPIAIGIAAASTGQAAQPLGANFICATPPLCTTGGFQNSSDLDIGEVWLHFSVVPGTPDGDYGWAYTADGGGGGGYSVRIEHGVVTSGQGLLWVRPSFFWNGVIGAITVTGSEHVHMVSPRSEGFYIVAGDHDCCCEYGCSMPATYMQVIEGVVGEAVPDENQTKQCDLKTGCPDCFRQPMASYSIHLMLSSLHIEDTPISYNSPRGPSTDFKVVYNQREANQPTTFSYSNLGPKWTCNWLSYVTDDGPAAASTGPTVYVRGGGTEVFGGFDSGTQSYAPERQTLAVLVRSSNSSYEKRFSNGAKEVFSQSDGSTSSPRRIFLTSVVDAAGNATTLTYDGTLRLTTITDSLGQSTSLTYGLAGDPLKITKVTDPFGRFATFDYTSGKLAKITDPVGIESQFGYASGSDFISTMTTPSGTTTFTKGETGNSIRWLEVTDPRGGKERVESDNSAVNIPSAEASAPAGVYNNDLQFRNTFYWDKKAMVDAPGDYTAAQVFHWLVTPDGKVSGIKHSEKKALESRVWYTYPEQVDPTQVGGMALPTRIARIVDGGVTQLSQSEYNEIGNLLTETDPLGRVKSYRYDANNLDVLEVYQRNPTGASWDPAGQRADKIAAYTYNSLHEPLTETDASGQVTTYTYNAAGQILTRTNAKNETTTYSYGGTVPAGYLALVMSPPFNGLSAVTRFGYDGSHRVRTVTNEADQSTVTTDYDNLDRKIQVTYPDATYEQFQYTDNVTGRMTLDLTGSRDRAGRWTYRHYDANRKMDMITDPLGRPTLYGWCTCGSLESITDPNGNVTSFRRDLQSRIYQKAFSDSTTIDYLFEGQAAPNTVGKTSRLKSATDARNRRTNYTYSVDNSVSQVSYTDSSGDSLIPPTPTVDYTYDPNYNRLVTMTDGAGETSYAYYPVTASSTLGAGKLQSVDGPLGNDTITFTYDELGRAVSQSIDGVVETVTYDSLGRRATVRNALGYFEGDYEGVTSRLHTLTFPNGQTTNFSYYGNDHDRRLQTLQNFRDGETNLSKFDYTYDPAGQIKSWGKLLDTASSGLWFDYDDAQQLVSVRNALDPSLATQRADYGYDDAGNRVNDSDYDPRPVPIGGWLNGTFTVCTANALNQLDSRAVQINNVAPERVELIYDLAGNLIDDGEHTTLEWDAANRLITISHPGNRRTEFSYDGLGRRVQIVEKAGSAVTSTKRFVWIGNAMAQERDKHNFVTRRYFAEGEQRVGPSPFARGGSINYFYTRDHLGSIREVTDNRGLVVARYDYDPYGKRTKLNGAVDIDFAYTGHYYHAPSGLDLTLYRAYSPSLGRWISRDPIGEKDGLNLFAYVQDDPLNAIDPIGLLRIYGHWCGPDWTGGRRESYTPHSPDYYRLATSALDAACENHDICYYQCRKNFPCDADVRSLCFKNCDRTLANEANLLGGFWGRIIGLAIGRPGERDPEPNALSCCQVAK